MQENKAALARSLGISRQALYYSPRLPKKDEALRDILLETWKRHPAYGHRRIAIHLEVNKKRILRVMRKYKIYPTLQKKRRIYGQKTIIAAVPNRLKEHKAIAPNQIWVGDFTYLWYKGRYIYLATVLDMFTREVIGWQIGLHHTTRLVIDVLEEAKRKRGCTPDIFHSDQGSEYAATLCIEWLIKRGILPSHSPKGKPWINGRQESFFNTFKFEFGKTHFYPTIETLIEAIGKYIHYYNSERIHSALKTSPQKFCDKQNERQKDEENQRI
jgi:putative transposase